jgi:hypothetical protein
MLKRHEFRPDLNECTLEDRFLPALPPGLAPSPFLAVNSASNQMVSPGSVVSTGAAVTGSSLNAGPTFFYIRLGVSLSGFGLAGSSIGGTVSIFGLNTNLTASGTGGGGGGGKGAGGGSSTGTGGFRSFGGYGASFSSGYSFALSGLNNYGMSSTAGVPPTLGSVPVHTFSGGGDAVGTLSNMGSVPVRTYGGGGEVVDDSLSNPDGSSNARLGNQNAGSAPYLGPVYAPQGPHVNPWNRSPGKNPAAASLSKGPG